tara:strand:- start:100 stop:780 length:681 start_codon:yes stop_codon:yes gene_type:complete
MAVHIIGADCSLGEAVVDKLLGMDIDVIAAEESHFVRNEIMLRYSKSNLSKTGKGFSVSFDGSEADIIVGKDIIVTDMIPNRSDKWMPQEIKSWIEGNNHDSQPRYWVSIVDVATAVAHIAKNEQKIDQIKVCGRRRWLPENSKAEFDMLWQRTQQGQSGNFTTSVLFGHEIAGMEAVPITDEEYSRPDLKPLHKILNELTNEGWRPLIPFRTALMTLIAGILEEK